MIEKNLTPAQNRIAMDILAPHLQHFNLRGTVRAGDTGCWLRVEKVGMVTQLRLEHVKSQVAQHGIFLTTMILPDDHLGVELHINFWSE